MLPGGLLQLPRSVLLDEHACAAGRWQMAMNVEDMAAAMPEARRLPTTSLQQVGPAARLPCHASAGAVTAWLPHGQLARPKASVPDAGCLGGGGHLSTAAG